MKLTIPRLLICILGLLGSEVYAQDLEIQFSSGLLLTRRYEQMASNLCPKFTENSPYQKGYVHCGSSALQSNGKGPVINVSDVKGNTVITSKMAGKVLAKWRVNVVNNDVERTKIVESIISRHLVVLNNQRLINEFVLANLSKNSNSIGINKNNEYYEKKTGKTLSFEKALKVFEQENETKKHYFRAAINVVSVLGIGTAQYWSDKDFNRPDWEYGFDWKSYRKKIITGEAVKFDTNNFATNAINHPIIAGSSYYTGSRVHGISSAEAFLYAFTGSLLWEYLCEFRERVSINDMIATPIGGAVIGETMFRLSEFLWSSKDSFLNKLFASVVDPVGSLNRWLYKEYPRNSKELDKHGFNKNVFHDFSFRFGTQTGENIIPLNANLKLLHIKDHNEAGERSGFIKMGEMTRIELRALIGKDGLAEFDMLNQAAIGAYYREKITQDKLKRKEGYSVLIGFASSYEYGQKKYGQFEDQIGIVNIVGTHLEMNAFIKGLHIQFVSDASADFTQITSLAVSKLEESGYDLDQTKSVLAQKKYYFAYGATIRSRAKIEYKRLSLEGSYDYHKAMSLQGQDRGQNNITDDFTLTDSRHYIDLMMSLRIFKEFRVSLGYKTQFLFGRAKNKKESLRDDQYYLQFGVKY